MHKCIKKIWDIYTSEYHSTIRKDEILPFGTRQTKQEGVIFKQNKSQKESPKQ